MAGVVEASYVFEDGKFSGAACEPILYPYLIFVFNYLFKTVLSDKCALASTQNGGQTKLQAKGRLIFPSEKILTFDSGKYSERAGVGAEYEDKAPVQAEVLKLLKASQKLTVNEMANTLGKDKGQVSIICTKLSEDGKIKRKNRKEPWEYVQQIPDY